MCDQDEKCLRAGDHPGVRHRYTQTKQERSAALRAQATAHLSTTETTKVGRYTLTRGDAIRLKRPPGKSKWLGIFSHLEHNTRSGKTCAVIVGGKVGMSCLTKYVDPDDLIYLRPDSQDARIARTFVRSVQERV